MVRGMLDRGFVGSDEAKERWGQEKVETWGARAKRLERLARASPQTASANLMMLIQQEWKFALGVNPIVGPLLAPLETAMWDNFLPDLLGGSREEVTNSL